MSKSNPRDQIEKAAYNLVEGIKDVVAANIATTAQQAKLDVNKETLPKLLAIINASIEEGYHRAARNFSKTVGTVIETAETEGWKQGNRDAGGFEDLNDASSKTKKKPVA